MLLALTDGELALGVAAQAPRDNIANHKRIKLPPGFKIDLFAVVSDARHMAVEPSTNMVFVGTCKTTVWAVADEVKAFAPPLNFKVPNGVRSFPAAEFFYEGPDVAVGEVEMYKQLGIGGIVRMKTDDSKREVFAEGWLDSDTSTYRGRPLDVAPMKDGSMRVSDDYAGAIYRISYAN